MRHQAIDMEPLFSGPSHTFIPSPLIHRPAAAADMRQESPSQRADYYLGRGRYEQAIPHFNEALKQEPDNASMLCSLAFCLFHTDRLDLSLRTYQLAHQRAPLDWNALCGIGNCYQSLGNFAQATSAYITALEIDPNNIACLYNLAMINGFDLSHPYARRIAQLHAQRAGEPMEQVLVCFALARLYEVAGKHRHAFTYYEQGNLLARTLHPYHEVAAFHYLRTIETTYSRLLHARPANLSQHTVRPIFVLGMPRSGTSLIEQILASHPSVTGAGELGAIPDIATRLIPEITGQRGPQAAISLQPQAIERLASHYISILQSHNPQNKAYVVDKLPSNYLHVGLIALMFPNAIFIHCTRDAMDTCWSLYRHYFHGNHPFIHDQATLGRYHLRYQHLMAHWHRLLPGRIYDLSYERLVTQGEPVMREMLTHCGLEWDTRCLTFHDTRRSVRTASMQQVRQPIYQHALGSWAPVADKLSVLHGTLTGIQPITH